MHFKPVTHVIFDMDGLIIESESIYKRILSQIAEQHGKKYTEEIQQKVLGTTERDIAKVFLNDLGIPLTIEQFLEVYHKKVQEQLQNPSLMPGAERLIVHLAKRAVPMAVATSSSREAFSIKTKNHRNVFELFSHVVCGSTDADVTRGKPAPDIFLVCAARFPQEHVDPGKCLVLEDAPNGIKGAISAGMQGVLVPAKNVEEGERNLATLVIETLEEFRPELFGLPPFDD